MINDNGREQDAPRSILIIQFAVPGAAEFQIKSENVSPAQLMAAAAWLDWYARRQFDATLGTRSISVPQVVLPSNLKQ